MVRSTLASVARSGRKMNRATLIRLVLALALSTPAAAQNALEIISLRHRTAEQVLPALRPLLEPGATLSGQQNQLFLRASPATVADIRLALEAIDRPLRRLRVLVRFDESGEAAARNVEASGRVGNRGSDIEVRAQDSRSASEERADQRLQVLEGSRAMIFSGRERPITRQQLIQTPAGVISQPVTVYEDRTSGFEVIPRLSGSTVHVEIAPQRWSGDTVSRAATTVSGPLGRWFELGAVASSAARDERGIASASRSSSSETRRVWIRVDELP
jgi:type II secretory pathway component GspD/PulD (secretin)